MKIEFVKAWRHYEPGNVSDLVPAGVAGELVRRGIAHPHQAVEKPLIPPAPAAKKPAAKK